jgi:hypothetical protein
MSGESLEALEQLFRDVLGSETVDEFLVVTSCLSEGSWQSRGSTHMPVEFPSASTPPSTSNGVMICSFASAFLAVSDAGRVAGAGGLGSALASLAVSVGSCYRSRYPTLG